MAIDPEKKRRVEKNEFVRTDIDVEPRLNGRTGAFSAEKHRYYTLKGLAGNARQNRINSLLDKIAKFSEQTGEGFPYAFIDREGKTWSIDAGCLNAIGPKHQGLVDFVFRGKYVVAVKPTAKLLARQRDAPAVSADVLELLSDPLLRETERKQLINARLGQGSFRADVLASWHGRCAVTSCELNAVLRASHILPWRHADNAQRLEPENGLPLVATLDALFDAGLISFDDDGRLLSKSSLKDHPNLIPSGSRLSKSPSPKMQTFLNRHRQQHGF